MAAVELGGGGGGTAMAAEEFRWWVEPKEGSAG